jgi:hypothetical protein
MTMRWKMLVQGGFELEDVFWMASWDGDIAWRNGWAFKGGIFQLRSRAYIAERPEANDSLYFKILDIHCRYREDLCRGDVPTNGMSEPPLRAGRTPLAAVAKARSKSRSRSAMNLCRNGYFSMQFLQSHDSEVD